MLGTDVVGLLIVTLFEEKKSRWDMDFQVQDPCSLKHKAKGTAGKASAGQMMEIDNDGNVIDEAPADWADMAIAFLTDPCIRTFKVQ